MKKLKDQLRSKTFHVGAYSVLSSVAVIIIVIVVNMLAAQLPSKYKNIDLTDIGLFSLTEQTVDLISGLDEDIQIYRIVQGDSADDYISQLLERYNDLTDRIAVSTIDPVINPNFASQYTSGQVNNNSLVVVSGARSFYLDYYSIYVYDYMLYNATGNEQDIQVEFDGENALTGAISYVVSDELPRIYALSGHGEADLDADYARAAASENFEIIPFSFLTSGGIPEDCDCLFINAPSSDISAEEAQQIRAYLDQGGNLILVTNYSTREKLNLLGLMEYYGMTVADGIVMDADADHSMYGYYSYLLPDLAGHIITDPLRKNGYYVLMPLSEGLQVLSSTRDNLTITPLLATSTTAYSKVAGLQFQTFDWEPGDGYGPFYLGIATTQNTYKENAAKIAWYSSSFLLNSTTNDVVSGGNMDLFLNTLGWTCGQEASITVHSRSLTPDYLTIPSSAVNRWSLITIGLIPALILLTGVFVIVKRRRG